MTTSTDPSELRARIEGCVFHPGTEQCCLWKDGHLVHFIRARLVGETPWGWRDAFVAAIDGMVLTLRDVAHDVEFQAWHHQDLSRHLSAGSPVRFHQQYRVISGPFGLACVLQNCPLPVVPVPAHPELWAAQMTGGVVNVATGYGIDLDAAQQATNE